MDYKNWAQRRTSRGGQATAPATHVPTAAPAQTLPAPPPGYAWATHPQHGFIMVPMAQPSSAPAITPPIRQPAGVRPFVPQALTSPFPPGRGTERVETCVLVKPGDKDTYADMLAGLTDLVPDMSGGYDAMAGNPSPTTVQETAGCTEFSQTQDGRALNAYPDGAQFISGSKPLGKGN